MFSHKFLLCSIGLSVILGANANDDVKNPRPRYHVDVLKLNDDESLQHVCSGAILDKNHVITTAHCVSELKINQLRVRSGSDVAPPADMPHHEQRLFHRVLRVMYPANYVPLPCRAHEHDIAIFKVDRVFDLAYDKLYKQVNLPEASNDYEGYNAVVSGYVNNVLKTFDANVISNEECAKNATSIITKGNLCAIVPEYSTASSDAPLIHDDTLVGFMNAPSKCETQSVVISQFECVKQSATLKLFTRITSYLEFIRKVLNSEPSADIVTRS